ncbi:F-box domain-containing protein [Aphelenchoides bicaudatus]|nr:F-box domain-containing protein [Aphelenchoides bicaudatus]
MPNFAIFGERVVRKALPPPPKAINNRLAVNKQPEFLSHRLLKKPGELEAKVVAEKPKKIVVRRVVRRRVKKEDAVPYRPRVIPNLPDKILWCIFDLLDYKSQCKAETVCRHWQRLIRNKQKREIKDLSIEMLGSRIEVLQQKFFKRLSITCPHDAFDFLSGVMRRSHALLSTLTCDFGLLANASQLNFETEGHRWKYFAGLEQLWLLITRCPTDLLNAFCKIEPDLFTELQNLTIQIHNEDNLENVGSLVKVLVERHSTAEIDLELHANNNLKILKQLENIENLQLNRLKIVCSALDAAPLNLNSLVDQFQRSNIKFKKIVFQEWFLNFDQNNPVVVQPVQLLHLNSCSINRSKEMIGALYKTMTQKRKKKPSSQSSPAKKPMSDQNADDKENQAIEVVQFPIKPKKVVRKKVQYIKRMEMAGSIQCTDLMFLASKQHIELEEQIARRIPNLLLDFSEIYYFE